MGGINKATSRRLDKMIPLRLRPVADLLERALTEVHEGKLDTRAATAMASLAGALIRVICSGELEDRLRALEKAVQHTNGRTSL